MKEIIVFMVFFSIWTVGVHNWGVGSNLYLRGLGKSILVWLSRCHVDTNVDIKCISFPFNDVQEFNKCSKGIANTLQGFVIPELLGMGIEANPDESSCEAFLLRTEPLNLEYEVEVDKVKEVGSSLKYLFIVFKIMEDHREKVFWAKFEFHVACWFPFIVYLP